MSFSFFEVLLILGITQGLVAVPALLFSKEKRLSKTLLALAIASFCMMFLKVLFNYTGISNSAIFRYLPNAFELTTAPLFYLYLRALTEKSFHWHARLIVHFIPFCIAYLFALLMFIVTYPYTNTDLQDAAVTQFYYIEFKALEDWTIVLSILSYLFLGFMRFTAFQRHIRNSNADSAYPTLNWLRSILVLSVILWCYLVFNMSMARIVEINIDHQMHWQIYYIYVAGVTYYLGVMSYRQQALDLDEIYQEMQSEIATLNEAQRADTAWLADAFCRLIESEKMYLEPKLTLRQVAEHLAINQSNLSFAINRHFEKSFRELINDYRIEDVKAKLSDRENKASVLSLALESGFNSEASFYRIFKKSTGLSPTQFIDSVSRTL